MKQVNPITPAIISHLKLLLVLVLFTNSAKAQTGLLRDAYVTMFPSPDDSVLLDGTFTLLLNDTLGITNMQVKLGTDSGLTDIMTQVFAFDVTAGLPAGYSYNRTGKKVILGIGTFNDKSTYFGEVRLQLSNGTWTAPFQFISN